MAQIHHVNISSSPQVLPFYKRNLLPQHSSSGRMNGLHISRSLSNCSLLTTHLLESKKPLYPYAASLSFCVLISHSYLFHLPPLKDSQQSCCTGLQPLSKNKGQQRGTVLCTARIINHTHHTHTIDARVSRASAHLCNLIQQLVVFLSLL